MHKTILFLMNGLGIEHKDSYNIFSSELMPTLDHLTKTELFTSIQAPSLNYEDAVQYFSVGTLEPLSFPYIQNILENNQLPQNPKFSSFQQDVFNSTGNFHFFCFLDSEKVHESIKKMMETIDLNSKVNTYLHFVLTGDDLNHYQIIQKVFSHFKYDLPQNVKVGLIFGIDLLEKEEKGNELIELVRMFYKGIGEKWRAVEEKITSLRSLRVLPKQVKPFYVNDGFSVSENDVFFFHNFDHYDCSRFLNLLKNPAFLHGYPSIPNLHVYSLFPLKYSEDVSYLYDNVTSEISFAKACEQVGVTALVFTDKKDLNMINFMYNGLSNSSNSHVKYVLTDNGILYQKEQMRLILNDPTYQLIIINHHIGTINEEGEMKQELQRIDQNLAMMLELCKDQYTLFVSSLYGLKKEILLSSTKKSMVDFSGVVPAVLVDSQYSKKEYHLSSGNTYTLLTTSLKCFNPQLKVNSLLKKKNLIHNILFKK